MPKPTFITDPDVIAGIRRAEGFDEADDLERACVDRHLALENISRIKAQLAATAEDARAYRKQLAAEQDAAEHARLRAVRLTRSALEPLLVPVTKAKRGGVKFPRTEVDYPGFPTEPSKEGAIVQMSLRMRLPNVGATKLYHYAVIRAGGRWFTTGSTCPPTGYTWRGLLDFATQHTVENFDIVGGA